MKLTDKIKTMFWGGVLAILLTTLCQIVWYKVSDVVWFETAEVVSIEERQVQLRVKAYKVRDCAYIANSEVGYMRVEGGDWEESGFSYLEDLTPNSTKPASWWSRLSFGVWEWRDIHTDLHETPVVQVQTTVGHDCGKGDIRTTTVGPFDLPSQQDQ